MCVRRSVFVLLLLLSCLPARAQEELTTLSSIINSKLLSLKSEMRILQDDLIITQTSLIQASKDLKLSEEERLTLQARSTTLLYSLQSINEKLNDSYAQLARYKTKLDMMVKVVVVLGIFAVVRTITAIIGFVLYAKGIKVPRWVDILL